MRTYRAEKHEGGEDNDPEVRGVEEVAAIELEDPTLGTWTNDYDVEQKTNQKTIS